jgi:hypothetical protein
MRKKVMNTDIRHKIEKILELAKRGVGGEKETAEKMLETLLTKYDLKIEDFEDKAKTECRIKFKGKFEKELAAQLLRKILNMNTFYISKAYKIKTYFYTQLTKLEFAEFMYLYEIFKPALHKHLKAAMTAFIWTNKLHSDNPTAIEWDTLTKEEKEQQMQAYKLTEVTKAIVVNKALTE